MAQRDLNINQKSKQQITANKMKGNPNPKTATHHHSCGLSQILQQANKNTTTSKMLMPINILLVKLRTNVGMVWQ